ncbi:MAG: acetylxylan esterase [Bryobacterales bacterium]|nr:acetylxylan esterase [Bryobacterales bacterium]
MAPFSMRLPGPVTLLLLTANCFAQSGPPQISRILKPSIVDGEVVTSRIQQYLLDKGKPLPAATSASDWTAQAARLRQAYLEKIVYRGWPEEWVNAPLRVEKAGGVPAGPGYRMEKLRYEIVPGFWTTAILYLPDPLPAHAPAILNVNGHVAPLGKSVEYKQKRCISQARHGVIALNPEWIGFGELANAENEHWFAAHIDLAGAAGVGVFYLAMRKGLDLLWEHRNVDRKRIAVTGLSGGGWQTITLSALDDRVAVAVPVAGYCDFTARVEREDDVGDLEQNPADSQTLLDYPHLTAMRAPRPTLLIYNIEDTCCFRAPLVKPAIYDAVRPFFSLYGKQNDLAWHQNADPGTHNYQLDNRMAAYRFLYRYLGLPDTGTEGPVDAEIKSYDELRVGLPPDNLTLLGLARKLAAANRRPGGSRADLAQVVRYRNLNLRHPWALPNTTNKGIDARPYRFDFANGLPATGVRIKALSNQPAVATIILDDRGRVHSSAAVSDRVNRGEDVLAADLLFLGDASPSKSWPMRLPQLIDAAGDRVLGINAAQLVTLANWMKATSRVTAVRLETSGIRSQTIALVAAALNPGLFREIIARDGMDSLAHLLAAPVLYTKAPELFCPALYQRFDLSELERFATPTVVRRIHTPAS